MKSKEALAQIRELIPFMEEEDLRVLQKDLYSRWEKLRSSNTPNISTESLDDATDK